MNILHIGNIAQNAYVNSIIFAKYGYACDVMAYDLYHFACSPEWYELFGADVSPAIIEDPFFPNFYSLGRAMPTIGPNVAHGPMFNALVYLDLRRRSDPLAHMAFQALRYLRFKCTALKTTTPHILEWGREAFDSEICQHDLPDELARDIIAGRAVDEALTFIRSRILAHNPGIDVTQLSVPFIDEPSHPLLSIATIDRPLAEYLEVMKESGQLFALGLLCPPSTAVDLSSLWRPLAPRFCGL
jgi:hypothetical protein